MRWITIKLAFVSDLGAVLTKLTLDRFPTDRHGWGELLPPRQPTQAPDRDCRVSWVIVGAGLTGLACARRLALLHPEEEILLLEARSVGEMASGRNSGFVVATSHFPGPVDEEQIAHCRRINRINQTGLELLDTQVAENAIDCQWRRAGFHHTAADAAALEEYRHFIRYLEALEIDHQPLDREAMRELLGTNLYQAGIHIADGALVQPAALVRGLADTLPVNVKLHEQSPVLEIGRGTPITLRLETVTVKTDKLIVATNFESVQLGLLGSYIVGSTLAGSFTRRLNPDELASLGSLTEWGAISLHSGGATLRLTADRRFSIRNTAEYRGSSLLKDGKLRQRQSIHRAAFEKRFPHLAHVPFEFGWSGVEGISRNSTNFFGSQDTNIYLAGGYNGSGVSRGTAFGTAIADYASGKTSQTVSDCLASAPGKWMPPRPLLDIAAFFQVRSRFKNVGLDR
jgi:glycine/D-amino acid oxidase-like deaminating enzyme